MRKFHKHLCQLCHRTITRFEIRTPQTSANFLFLRCLVQRCYNNKDVWDKNTTQCGEANTEVMREMTNKEKTDVWSKSCLLTCYILNMEVDVWASGKESPETLVCFSIETVDAPQRTVWCRPRERLLEKRVELRATMKTILVRGRNAECERSLPSPHARFYRYTQGYTRHT